MPGGVNSNSGFRLAAPAAGSPAPATGVDFAPLATPPTLAPAPAPPAGVVAMDLVAVGNPGNPDDSTGFGGVGHDYRIARFPVTIDHLPERRRGRRRARALQLAHGRGRRRRRHRLTDVGAFSASPSPYGTFDQNGNVWEWNDLDGTPDASRGLRGGYWFSGSLALQSALFCNDTTARESNDVGFRLAAPAAAAP